MRWPVIPKTNAELKGISTPGGAKSEAIPYVLFDTQSYAQAGASSLQFFLTQQTDATLGNLQTAGQLPNPQWFEIWGMFVDFLNVPTVQTAPAAIAALPGQLNDIELLLKTARMTAELTIAQKSYGVQPGTFYHSSGGAIGFTAGLFVAATAVSQGNNGTQGDTWSPNGSIIIPPTQGFNFVLRFVSTAISAATQIRVSLAGVLHRAVR